MIGSLKAMSSRPVLLATVPPLASIFGSGFLIIVPILERTLGALAALGIAGVCAFAWLIGTAIRHNVAVAEGRREEGELDHLTERTEQASDLVIAVAYVISVALYLRIMSQYVVEIVDSGSVFPERALACAAVLLIVVVGLARGFDGLDRMERIALIAVLALTALLGGALFISDAGHALGGGLDLPPVPGKGFAEILLVLGGIVITVQGFETVRYLSDEYDRQTRIWACRLSQLTAAVVYVAFVALATPMMGLGTSKGVDGSLLDISERLLPILSVAIVIVAVLSQFSAATADTVAAHGNLQGLFARPMRDGRPYVLCGAAAILLVWTIPTLTLVVIASRAFAAYYSLQCVVALRTSEGIWRKLGFGALALVLLAITLLAKPAT